jgi:hypothetical protein
MGRAAGGDQLELDQTIGLDAGSNSHGAKIDKFIFVVKIAPEGAGSNTHR